MQRSAFRYLLQHGKNDITSTQEEKLRIIPTLFCQKRSLVTVHYFAVVPITTNIAFSMTLSTLLVIRYFYVNAPELSHFDKRNWHNKIHGLIVIWYFLKQWGCCCRRLISKPICSEGFYLISVNSMTTSTSKINLIFFLFPPLFFFHFKTFVEKATEFLKVKVIQNKG